MQFALILYKRGLRFPEVSLIYRSGKAAAAAAGQVRWRLAAALPQPLPIALADGADAAPFRPLAQWGLRPQYGQSVEPMALSAQAQASFLAAAQSNPAVKRVVGVATERSGNPAGSRAGSLRPRRTGSR